MKITEKVYRLDATPVSYVYLIRAEEVVLVDTCMPVAAKGLLRELKAQGVEPKDVRHIILTHHDLDHVGNAVMLQKCTGAKLWASAEDIPYITGEKQRHSFKKYLSKLLPVKKPQDINPFVPGESVAGVEVIPAPGHTPGHVCFRYNGVILAGDLVENKKGGLRPYPASWDWDYARLLESWQKVASQDFEWLCPAHGQPVRREELPRTV